MSPARWPWRRSRRTTEVDEAGKHLERLRAQREHVERLADRLDHEQTNNHFRIRVQEALRGQG